MAQLIILRCNGPRTGREAAISRVSGDAAQQWFDIRPLHLAGVNATLLGTGKKSLPADKPDIQFDPEEKLGSDHDDAHPGQNKYRNGHWKPKSYYVDKRSGRGA
ncbi:hypothetical protein Slin15195_G042030 [Septoria linicola]|uniref:Uncharacterized protein n=1 Tax=Septoria linicola TaxID=215465 RepID=A0A9Q9AKA3_9PEZI|nr:hypothetical protein Slin14017_G045540 [Septoria linicola]USW50884.1 hypothetical protein Slin15195_G042030 [Septoria linicola]